MGLSLELLSADALPFSDSEFSDSGWPLTAVPHGPGVRGGTGSWVPDPESIGFSVAVVPAGLNALRAYVVAVQL